MPAHSTALGKALLARTIAVTYATMGGSARTP